MPIPVITIQNHICGRLVVPRNPVIRKRPTERKAMEPMMIQR